MGGQKMAKREGNIERPAEVYERGYPPRVLRYTLGAVQYRAPLEFGDESLQAAAAATDRLSRALAALDVYRSDSADDPGLPGLLGETRSRFAAALDDDLNVSGALGVIFELVRELNRRVDDRALSTADAVLAARFLRDLDTVFAVMEDDRDASLAAEEEALVEQRAAARAARDWAASDRLRDELARRGIAVEDTRDGQRWRRVLGEAHGQEG